MGDLPLTRASVVVGPGVGDYLISGWCRGELGWWAAPDRAILVGTASWADKSLVDSGKFYPPDVTSPEARLRYYASQFPMVEVDSSYYVMPLPVTTQQWAERTPEHFVFNIKSFRLFTGYHAQPCAFPKGHLEGAGARPTAPRQRLLLRPP